MILTGFDIFNESNVLLNTISRLIFYFLVGTVMLCFCYTTDLDKDPAFSDRIFISIANHAYISVLIQVTYFWHYRHKVFAIFEDIKSKHIECEEEWVRECSELMYRKCSKLYKICK